MDFDVTLICLLASATVNMADENLLLAVEIGDVVQLNGGEGGTSSIIKKTFYLGFSAYDILFASGKTVTDVRYRFD